MTALSTSTKLAGVARLWLLNFLGNAAALTVIYGWLLIPDAHGWQVAASALIALAGVFLMAWLRAGTFAHFRVSEFRERADLWPAFRRGLRHLIPLIVCGAVFFALAWWIWSLRDYTPQFGVWLRQKLNAGPPPRNVTRDANWLIVLIIFVLLPAVWLPIASTIAGLGLRLASTGRSLRVLRRGKYWLWLCVLVVLGAYLPYRLVWWIPDLSSLPAQAWSMGLRFFAAYVLAVSGWIGLNWVAGVFAEREDADLS